MGHHVSFPCWVATLATSHHAVFLEREGKREEGPQLAGLLAQSPVALHPLDPSTLALGMLITFPQSYASPPWMKSSMRSLDRVYHLPVHDLPWGQGHLASAFPPASIL